jgi:hypothetical protein
MSNVLVPLNGRQAAAGKEATKVCESQPSVVPARAHPPAPAKGAVDDAPAAQRWEAVPGVGGCCGPALHGLSLAPPAANSCDLVAAAAVHCQHTVRPLNQHTKRACLSMCVECGHAHAIKCVPLDRSP